MNRTKHIENFIKLGKKLSDASIPAEIVDKAVAQNRWFTPQSIELALEGTLTYLDAGNLQLWMQHYPERQSESKIVGVIMAGNIPMVGFHDLISVLISGHRIRIKLSSLDEILLPYLVQLLTEIDTEYHDLIHFNQDFKGIDALIATGSDNSARYFEYYFRHIPRMIRQNRSSVAVLTGNESEKQLHLLGKDIFDYFGLGCRNVSKLWVPEDYTFDKFFENMYSFHSVIEHNKYANNYQYYRSVFLIKKVKFLDNGFLLVKEEIYGHSPVSVIHYQHYQGLSQVKDSIETQADQIQCCVGEIDQICDTGFGESQKPDLWDYADQSDTIQFLSNL